MWIYDHSHLLPLSPLRSGAVLLDGQLRVPDLEGDFSLNASNVLSADLLMRRGGLTRLAPTHDLDARQMAALARGLGPRADLLEAIVHQHLPIFHTGRQSVTFIIDLQFILSTFKLTVEALVTHFFLT